MVTLSAGVRLPAYPRPVAALMPEPEPAEPLPPPVLPTVLEVAADPARSAVAAALAVHLAQQLGLADVVADALDVLAACLDRMRAA